MAFVVHFFTEGEDHILQDSLDLDKAVVGFAAGLVLTPLVYRCGD